MEKGGLLRIVEFSVWHSKDGFAFLCGEASVTVCHCCLAGICRQRAEGLGGGIPPGCTSACVSLPAACHLMVQRAAVCLLMCGPSGADNVRNT